MSKFGDAIVLFLIWGVVLGSLFSYVFSTHPAGNNLFASTILSLNKSTEQKNIISVSHDGGKSFKSAIIHLDAKPNIFSIKISPNDPNLVFAATDYGLLISRDGGLNWYDNDPQNNVKIDKNDIQKVRGLDIAGNNLYLGLSNGRILVYSLKENSWQFIDSRIEDKIISAIEVSKNTIIVGAQK